MDTQLDATKALLEMLGIRYQEDARLEDSDWGRVTRYFLRILGEEEPACCMCFTIEGEFRWIGPPEKYPD
jgi:hypothetical protein